MKFINPTKQKLLITLVLFILFLLISNLSALIVEGRIDEILKISTTVIGLDDNNIVTYLYINPTLWYTKIYTFIFAIIYWYLLSCIIIYIYQKIKKYPDQIQKS